MQARLERSEFAYLLHLLEAKRVIGVNNASLFVETEVEREALLTQGMAALQAHGWLVESENGFHTHSGLVRMVAVTAVPDTVLLVTRYQPDNGQQILTYYRAQNWLVEQFLTTDGFYILTELSDTAEMTTRLQEAFAIPSSPVWPMAFTLETAVFTHAMTQSHTDPRTAWQTALRTITDEPNALELLTHRLSGLRRVGLLDAASLQGTNLQARADLLLLHDREEGLWAMTATETAVTLTPLHQTEFMTHIINLLQQVQS